MADIGALTAREIALLARFVELLKDEQETLRRADPEPLADIGAAKVALVEQLNALENERRDALAIDGAEKIRSAMSQWLAANPTQQQVARDWQTLLELAGEAKELHNLNAGLVALHLQQTGDALHVLDARRAGDSLYGSNGQTTATSGSRLVDSA
ncbi:MAG: flagellar protein FlgN [Betaproteobacteria bacterium]|nr:flagellar protein FlgN [Betaproteobacteria bacterium]MCL2885306.1 flagellar protein FlgN [Betaproteobacteria bacterium]